MTSLAPGPSLTEWRASAEGFAFEGLEIPFHSEGEGPPLLLVHGYPTASWDFAPMWTELTARYRVIVADMLGFGDAPKPRDGTYTISRQADLQEALLAHLGVDRVRVLAHDYGDTVVQELLAREAPFDSVCFLNGGIFPETHEARPIQKLLAGPLGPLLVRFMGRSSFERSFSAVFGPDTQPSAEAMNDYWQLVSSGGGLAVLPKLITYMEERRRHRERWVGAITRSTVPLRLVDGIADSISGGHMVDHYEELVPNPDVVRLPGIGHYPQVEAPRAVLDALVAFHERLERGAASSIHR